MFSNLRAANNNWQQPRWQQLQPINNSNQAHSSGGGGGMQAFPPLCGFGSTSYKCSDGGTINFAVPDPTSFTFGKNLEQFKFTFQCFSFESHPRPQPCYGVKRAGAGIGDEGEREVKRRRRNRDV